MKKDKEENKEEPKTETMEAKVITASKADLFKFTFNEFAENYNGVFHKGNMEGIDGDLLATNLLFAIFAELRIQREILKK